MNYHCHNTIQLYAYSAKPLFKTSVSVYREHCGQTIGHLSDAVSPPLVDHLSTKAIVAYLLNVI